MSKKILSNDLHFRIINILVFLTILCIPLYALRIQFFNNISISILTLISVCTNMYLLLFYHKYIRGFFVKNALWSFATLFICAFLPSLFIHPSVHSFGVFLEWLLIPFCSGILFALHTSKKPQNLSFLIYSLITSLICVLCIAIFYLLQDKLTFDHRLSAFYLSPNHLAMYISPILWIVSSFMLLKRTSVRMGAAIVIIIGLSILFMTQSFNTLLALICAGSILTYKLCAKKMAFLIIFFCIVLCLTLFGALKLQHSNADISHSSFASRLVIWDVAMFLMHDDKFFGHQIDSFQEQYLAAQMFYPAFPDWAVPTPHNILATIFFSGGFFATVFFLLMIFKILYETEIFFHNETHKKHLVFFYAAFFTIILSGFADTPVWKNDLSLLFWIIVAIMISTIHHDSASRVKTQDH